MFIRVNIAAKRGRCRSSHDEYRKLDCRAWRPSRSSPSAPPMRPASTSGKTCGTARPYAYVPVDAPIARTPGPTWAVPNECYTDEGYGRYLPCGARHGHVAGSVCREAEDAQVLLAALAILSLAGLERRGGGEQAQEAKGDARADRRSSGACRCAHATARRGPDRTTAIPTKATAAIWPCGVGKKLVISRVSSSRSTVAWLRSSSFVAVSSVTVWPFTAARSSSSPSPCAFSSADIALAEFGELLRIVLVPFAQPVARREVLHPGIELELRFRQAARPQPVDQDAQAVVRRTDRHRRA